MSDTRATSDATTTFFETLADRGHEPLLEKARGTVCVELTNGAESEPWVVTIDRGDVTVSQGSIEADCTLRASSELFEQIAAGKANAVAAVFRGAVAIEGNWHLLVLFQRLFPGPSGAGAATGATGAGERR